MLRVWNLHYQRRLRRAQGKIKKNAAVDKQEAEDTFILPLLM